MVCSGVAAADPAESPATNKDAYLADKAASQPLPPEARRRWDAQLDKRIGKKPFAVVNVYNTWTHETVVFDSGAKTPLPPEQVNSFLRCHFTNQPTNMDQRLFPVLMAAAKKFQSLRIEIVSGFRAEKYNLMLRKKGHGVARNSQHPQGHAVDFRVQGVSTDRLRSWAESLRVGGVGYYPGSGFVHVDTGPVRRWTDE